MTLTNFKMGYWYFIPEGCLSGEKQMVAGKNSGENQPDLELMGYKR